jgi:hypothetical protein
MNDTANIAGHVASFSLSSLFPALLWILFWLLLLFWARDFIKITMTILLNRLKHGAGLKIGSFELQSLKVVAANEFRNSHFNITDDVNDQKYKERALFYESLRGVIPVHKIFKSQIDGQLYDFLIYVIPHRNSNLIQVKSVDYYFGKHWGGKIFTAIDRSNGFAIATSAWAPFLCSIKINFTDDKSTTVFHYIDFEMGDVASMTEPKLDETKN